MTNHEGIPIGALRINRPAYKTSPLVAEAKEKSKSNLDRAKLRAALRHESSDLHEVVEAQRQRVADAYQQANFISPLFPDNTEQPVVTQISKTAEADPEIYEGIGIGRTPLPNATTFPVIDNEGNEVEITSGEFWRFEADAQPNASYVSGPQHIGEASND